MQPAVVYKAFAGSVTFSRNIVIYGVIECTNKAIIYFFKSAAAVE